VLQQGAHVGERAQIHDARDFERAGQGRDESSRAYALDLNPTAKGGSRPLIPEGEGWDRPDILNIGRYRWR
jgi:hypothetical protein